MSSLMTPSVQMKPSRDQPLFEPTSVVTLQNSFVANANKSVSTALKPSKLGSSSVYSSHFAAPRQLPAPQTYYTTTSHISPSLKQQLITRKQLARYPPKNKLRQSFNFSNMVDITVKGLATSRLSVDDKGGRPGLMSPRQRNFTMINT